uniref:Uncharacterized protein n=1 Tax=Panagrolaimus sp. ES5 TaxID=591445 RepID=A0AC34G609_9BILA
MNLYRQKILKPDRLACYNCKGKHIIEKCKWTHCVFCWSQLYGQHHRCQRDWIYFFYTSAGSYRRKIYDLIKNGGFKYNREAVYGHFLFLQSRIKLHMQDPTEIERIDDAGRR